jgi:predicted nucleic acid-binding protein
VSLAPHSERLYSLRNLEDMERTQTQLASLHSLPVTEAAERGLQASMLGLAASGQHRMPISDLLLAAIAQAHGAVVLHYDAAFERIAEVTGQRHEWIVPRGTGHGAG